MSMFHELMMKKKGMPSRYQEVEYIESDGTQYIKTGYIPNINTEFIVDCSFDDLSVGRFGRIVSSAGIGGRFYFGVVSNYYAAANSSVYKHNIMSADTNEHLFTLDKEGLYIDEELKWQQSGNVAEDTADLYLFATHDLVAGTGDDKVNYYAQCKVRYCTIKENGVVKRNYIPVYDTETQKYGMWESVQGKFYGNAGAGDFKGSIVGYTVVGSPTITDGVVSGFTENDYLVTNQNFPNDKAINGFEFQTKFSLSDKSVAMILFGIYFDTSVILSGLYSPADARIRWFITSTNNISTNISTNQFYFVRCVIKDNKMSLYLGTTKDNMQLIQETDITSFTLTTPVPIYIGRKYFTINMNPAIYATIDLNETYIKINNKLWFNGQQA